MTSYRVGDWVYCETGPQQPYVIRKIEELTKTPCGNVEAKVICAFRRQDIPSSVLASVENYQKENKELEKKEAAAAGIEGDSKDEKRANDPTATHDDFDEALVKDLTEQQRYNLKHRELYFSKYTDTIAATTIRSKCSVLLFNEEVEKYSDYLAREDSFFYHLTYDPYQKSLVADQGEIRVGSRYQAEVPALQSKDEQEISEAAAAIAAQEEKRVLRKRKDEEPEVPFCIENMERLVWSPMAEFFSDSSFKSLYNKLNDTEIDQYLLIAKSVGTYARALDCNNAFKQPSLPLSAAFASRDITVLNALDILHESRYEIGKAVLQLVPTEGPLICKDEIEEWSAAEANIFEEAFDKIGKDFGEIRAQYLPWKSFKSIIEYYYTWKTTDRYVQQKRIKLSEQESKLKQVYIPNHSKQNQSALIKSMHVQLFNQYDTQLKQSCESCGTPNTSTNQWYAYNLTPVTQLIMSNQHNPTLLANAAAQLTASNAANNTSNSHINFQARLCADCWTYWKKHHAFKFPNARQERLNQLKNQVHKCSVNGCGREFKLKQLLVKHCGTAHGYFAKTSLPPGQNSPRPSAIRNRTSFFLLTTPMTKAARLVCPGAIKLNKLSRKPFKLVELAELNKEWGKTHSIEQILAEYKKKTFVRRLLNKELIAVIAKSYAKLLRRRKKTGNDQLLDGDSQEDESDDELIIDNDEDSKPEYFKYFENKCTEPCYTPTTLLYPKPDKGAMNRFYDNLMNQNKKRPLDTTSTNGDVQTNGETNSVDTSPLSKRANSNINGQTKPVRMPQKSVKPTQSINLLNAPEEIYYVANKQLKNIRKEIQPLAMRKLSRKPSKELKNCEKLYDCVAQIRNEALDKIVKTDLKSGKATENSEINQKKSEDDKAVEENDDVEMNEEDVLKKPVVELE